jgi:hypothetical protein
VDDVARLLEHLGIDGPVTLAVHDWGGMIGFGWALSHQAQVRRLVITNTAAFPLPAAKPMPWQLNLCRNTMLGAFLIRAFNAFAAGTARDCVVRKLSKDVYRGYVAPYDSWANRISTLRFVQDIPLAEGDPAWALLKACRRMPICPRSSPGACRISCSITTSWKASSVRCRTPRCMPSTMRTTTCWKTSTRCWCRRSAASWTRIRSDRGVVRVIRSHQCPSALAASSGVSGGRP